MALVVSQNRILRASANFGLAWK